MKSLKIATLSLVLIITGCASGYRTINPTALNYVSKSESGGVVLEYKYELLEKKYKKKELAKGVKLVAIKLTNKSGKDLTFGKDIKLQYTNNTDLLIVENEKVFKTLKQSAASYLWYLLLTPLQFQTTETVNGYQTKTSSTPIGYVVGPGLAGGNMIAVGSANKKFKQELLDYNINGRVITNGETVVGLIGVESDSSDSITLRVE